MVVFLQGIEGGFQLIMTLFVGTALLKSWVEAVMDHSF